MILNLYTRSFRTEDSDAEQRHLYECMYIKLEKEEIFESFENFLLIYYSFFKITLLARIK